MNPSTSLSRLARSRGGSPISDLMKRALDNPGLISLAAGFVDAASLPVEATLRAADEVLGDPVEGRRALQYGTTIGDPSFRTRLVRRLEQEEGALPGQFDRVIHRTVVTSGSQQLLYLVAEALLDPGDIVLVESPTYFVFLGLLDARGVRAVGVETDEGGLSLTALEQTLAPDRGRGGTGPGQADLHGQRALEPDRPEPGGGSPRRSGRAGEPMVEAAADLHPGRRGLSRPELLWG